MFPSLSIPSLSAFRTKSSSLASASSSSEDDEEEEEDTKVVREESTEVVPVVRPVTVGVLHSNEEEEEEADESMRFVELQELYSAAVGTNDSQPGGKGGEENHPVGGFVDIVMNGGFDMESLFEATEIDADASTNLLEEDEDNKDDMNKDEEEEEKFVICSGEVVVTKLMEVRSRWIQFTNTYYEAYHSRWFRHCGRNDGARTISTMGSSLTVESTHTDTEENTQTEVERKQRQIMNAKLFDMTTLHTELLDLEQDILLDNENPETFILMSDTCDILGSLVSIFENEPGTTPMSVETQRNCFELCRSIWKQAHPFLHPLTTVCGGGAEDTIEQQAELAELNINKMRMSTFVWMCTLLLDPSSPLTTTDSKWSIEQIIDGLSNLTHLWYIPHPKRSRDLEQEVPLYSELMHMLCIKLKAVEHPSSRIIGGVNLMVNAFYYILRDYYAIQSLQQAGGGGGFRGVAGRDQYELQQSIVKWIQFQARTKPIERHFARLQNLICMFLLPVGAMEHDIACHDDTPSLDDMDCTALATELFFVLNDEEEEEEKSTKKKKQKDSKTLTAEYISRFMKWVENIDDITVYMKNLPVSEAQYQATNVKIRLLHLCIILVMLTRTMEAHASWDFAMDCMIFPWQFQHRLTLINSQFITATHHLRHPLILFSKRSFFVHAFSSHGSSTPTIVKCSHFIQAFAYWLLFFHKENHLTFFNGAKLTECIPEFYSFFHHSLFYE